jgi:uncharacterized membrane protein
MESHRRSFAKALSWRLVALLITVTVTWLIFEDVRIAASVGLLDSLVKIVVYYLHERAWQTLSYGRPATTEQQRAFVQGAERSDTSC